MYDVMIDLETMGTSQDATICSIGACRFDPKTPNKIGDEFYSVVDWNINHFSRSINMDTLRWWLTQSDEARTEIARNDGVPLADALRDLSEFLGEGSVVWGNGATFDISILENAYEGYNIEELPIPWKFYNVCDVRTIVRVAKGIVDKPKMEAGAHNALADAIHQARFVSTMYSTIRKACGQ